MAAFDLSVSQSYGERYWTLRTPDDSDVRALTPHLEGDDLLARLLAPRGIDPARIDAF